MQKFLQKIGLAVPSLVLAFTTLAAVPVMAQGGSDDSTSGSTSTGSTETSHSGSGTEVATTTTTTGTETPEPAESQTELQHKGSDMVTELQKEHKSTKSDAEKTKVCEAHTKGLETKFGSISKNADAFQTRVTDIYNKALAYQKDNNVTVANWDTLTAAADAAQKASADSIAALKLVSPDTLDCNANGAVAQQVATFKVAAQTTRNNLKAYKAAVKDVLKALLSAKQASNTTDTKTTEGSNQ